MSAEPDTDEYIIKRDEYIQELYKFDEKYSDKDLRVLDKVKIKSNYNDSLLGDKRFFGGVI